MFCRETWTWIGPPYPNMSGFLIRPWMLKKVTKKVFHDIFALLSVFVRLFILFSRFASVQSWQVCKSIRYWPKISFFLHYFWLFSKDIGLLVDYEIYVGSPPKNNYELVIESLECHQIFFKMTHRFCWRNWIVEYLFSSNIFHR